MWLALRKKTKLTLLQTNTQKKHTRSHTQKNERRKIQSILMIWLHTNEKSIFLATINKTTKSKTYLNLLCSLD